MLQKSQTHRKGHRRFSEKGYEVFEVGEIWMKRREIRREFLDLERKEIVTVRRDLNNNPIYVELNFKNEKLYVTNPITGRAEWHSDRKRSWTISQQTGKRFINAQAWAIQETRREIKKRFRESNE